MQTNDIALYDCDFSGLGDYKHLCDTSTDDFLKVNRHAMRSRDIVQIKNIKKGETVVLYFYLGSRIKVIGL